ncbi:GTPase-activating protein GYP5 [Verticillium alfalfae VaMs.102]|uniref:GTPase-activating protein GYP5 n=1 Tax=Verticillium alfalfae (strain VaMs.102 / ATCC MYA-4576 / FGSC 10136) TaxID=526221 RepID=C9SL97_VERA1|nr:GTPase-activating protein GYP5 [Verticillium alfalfae VaMs.102]EEY19465.1 GTPase-activating protein GYP5 [Verticillium alfalfae VaMs.102]
MAHTERPASPPAAMERRPSTPGHSDKENDTFEDAVDSTIDTPEVRSLTKRTLSSPKHETASEPTESTPDKKAPNKDETAQAARPPSPPLDSDDETKKSTDKIKVDVDIDVPDKVESVTSSPKSPKSSKSHRFSNTSNLDNISLEDDAVTSSPPPPRPDDAQQLDEEREGHDAESGRNSLKDRFKLLRMREEQASRHQPLRLMTRRAPGGRLRAFPKKQPRSGISGARARWRGLARPFPDQPPKVTPCRRAPKPGTGTWNRIGRQCWSLGPCLTAQVDWDLWQSVVYEGPAVVARTSADELNRAIATGIPSAIRGVIWQVLAQSNNVELEAMYRSLKARGTEKDQDRNSNGTSISSASNGNLGIQNDAVNSSASSVHSDQSGTNPVASPALEKSAEAVQKAQAAVAEKKKRSKEDAVMLQKLEKTIRRDLGARTSYSKHAASAGLQEGLFGVCKAYALFDEGVGYAQGMNFLDMPGLHMRLYQFERTRDFEPALYCTCIAKHSSTLCTQCLTLSHTLPLTRLRIYDLILSEGLSAILRFGIVLMQKNASTLLAMSDMSQLTTHLKDKVFDVYIDKDPSAGSILDNGFFGSSSSSIDKEVYRADQLVRDACEVKITPETLKAYTLEWEEKTKAEKEREAELETLRAANAKYAISLRKLEERVEAYDREQAALATELVHTKVENEELKDENETYKGQVRELRNVIEKQPEELETAWQAERDDLMKRNAKVHEENQKLEKEMSELEEELVQTKMQYAEINASHETLARKWTDLKRQFA